MVTMVNKVEKVETERTGRRARDDWDWWVRRGCALLVATVAAYGSYEHQRLFALRGGADGGSAAWWPLSVDGLLVLASVGLLRSRATNRRGRLSLWSAFGLGIAVSLAANIDAAPNLTWQSVLVAGWPPIALLLAVELVAHKPSRDTTQTTIETTETTETAGATETGGRVTNETTEQQMWRHYGQAHTSGRVLTGADLDRACGTNNYGRRVLREWRTAGRIDRDGAPCQGPGRTRRPDTSGGGGPGWSGVTGV
jgi:hypothetical protein